MTQKARKAKQRVRDTAAGLGPVTIVEGPDGAGKTTLVKAYARLHPGVKWIHLGPHATDPFEELVAYLVSTPGPVVFDRFHLGEQAYGPVYRGRDGLGANGRARIERLLRKRSAVVVLALPPYPVCFANWEARKRAGGEMFPDPAQFKVLYDRYMMKVKTGLPVVMYDYTSHKNAWLNVTAAIDARRTSTYGGGQ